MISEFPSMNLNCVSYQYKTLSNLQSCDSMQPNLKLGLMLISKFPNLDLNRVLYQYKTCFVDRKFNQYILMQPH